MTMRPAGGFSLVPVIAIGMIASIWLLGMTALVMPSYQKVTKTKKVNVLRSAAETSLDWAVAQLNQNNPALQPAVGSFVRQDVPNSIIDPCGAFAHTSAPHATVYVFDQAPPSQMSNPPAAYTSYVYDPYFDPHTTHPTVKPTVNRNGWRRVVAHAVLGDPSLRDNVKIVQVILKPNYVPGQPQPGNPLPPVPFFDNAMFGGQSIGLAGNQVVDSYDSRLGSYGGGNILHSQANVGTNGNAVLNGNSHVYGDLIISNKVDDPTNSADPGYNITNADASGNIIIDGKLRNNGQVNGFTSTNVTQGITSGYQAGDYLPVKELPPTPAPPSSAVPLGDVALSGKQTITLTAGDYTASSINISGNAKIIINPSNGPVNIYMVGAGNISIAGNGISNSTAPSNFRLWNSSSAPMTIGGNGDLTGVVYAPNSAIKVNGNGSVYGSLVGSTVTLLGGGVSGGFHYDIALKDQSNGLTYQPVPPAVNTPPVVASLQTVSWQEVDWNMVLP